VKLITCRALQTQKKRRTELKRIVYSALLLIVSVTPVFASDYDSIGLSPEQMQKSYPRAAAEMIRTFPSCFRKSVLAAWKIGDGGRCSDAAIVAIEKEKSDAKH
jgi:hypothetical protein